MITMAASLPQPSTTPGESPQTPRRLLSFDVGLKHLAYADVSYGVDGRVRAIERWGVIDVTAALPCPGKKKQGAEALIAALIESLDVAFYDPVRVHYDAVLVENQPSRKNPAMKSVQVAIVSYFSTVRLHCGCVDEIRLISAIRKLQGTPPTGTATKTVAATATPAATTSTTSTASAEYRQRKALSVSSCRRALVDDDGILRHAAGSDAALKTLDAAKKKDDLADAMLQALAYLRDGMSAAKTKRRSNT